MDLLDASILVLLCLTLLNYALRRSVLYPPFLFSLMWLFDLVVFRSGLITIDPLHSDTLALVLAGALCFSGGGLLTLFLPDAWMRVRIHEVSPRSQSRLPKFALVALLTAMVPVIALDQVHKAAQGAGNTFLERAKNAAFEQAQQSGQVSVGIESYLVNSIAAIGIVILPLFLLEERDGLFWWTLLVAVFMALAGGGRGMILTIVLSTTGIRLIQTHKERFLAAARPAGIALGLFAVVFLAVIFTVKDTSSYSSLGGILGFFVVGYIVTPLAALDRVLQQPSDFAVSHHTFQFLLKPAAALNLLAYTPPPALDNFIAVPLPTNVYTVYRFLINDFGVHGCLAVLVVIGALHALLYRRAHLGGRLSLILFGLSLFPVVMVIFDDEYYYQIPFYLRSSVVCMLYWSACSLNWKVLPRRLRWVSSPPLLRLRLLPAGTRIRLRLGLNRIVTFSRRRRHNQAL